MPCNKCNHQLILGKTKDDLICPKCNKMNLLDKELAINILQKRVDWFNKALTDVLATFNKRRLIVWLIAYREKMMSGLFHGKPIIPIRDFLSVNALIKRVMKNYEIEGDIEANDENTPELIDSFRVYIQQAADLISVKEDYALMFYNKEFKIEELNDNKNLMKNFFVKHTEEWKTILDTLSLHNIINLDEAEKYYDEHKDEYEISAKPKKLERRTVKETINVLYPTMIQFFYALQLNIYFKTVFNFEYLKDTNINPHHLLKIVKPLKEIPGAINTFKPPSLLKRFIKKNFKELDKHKAYESLVFSKENQNIFPIFIRLDDHLFIPINTTKAISLFLYPFIYNKEFISIHNKKSDEFEKQKVKELFEKKGYKVYSNFIDKKNSSLEIDHLAQTNSVLYLVEVKAWDIKPFFEGRRIHIYRERDLKGVVDGFKYTGEKPKKIPSIVEKIGYVKNNLKEVCQKIGFNYQEISKIKGIVVTKSYPPLKEYKGIKFISFVEI